MHFQRVGVAESPAERSLLNGPPRVWGTDNASKEIEASGHSMAWKRLWAFLVKFLAPAVIMVILYFTVGRGQGLS